MKAPKSKRDEDMMWSLPISYVIAMFSGESSLQDQAGPSSPLRMMLNPFDNCEDSDKFTSPNVLSSVAPLRAIETFIDSQINEKGILFNIGYPKFTSRGFLDPRAIIPTSMIRNFVEDSVSSLHNYLDNFDSLRDVILKLFSGDDVPVVMLYNDRRIKVVNSTSDTDMRLRLKEQHGDLKIRKYNLIFNRFEHYKKVAHVITAESLYSKKKRPGETPPSISKKVKLIAEAILDADLKNRQDPLLNFINKKVAIEVANVLNALLRVLHEVAISNYVFDSKSGGGGGGSEGGSSGGSNDNSTTPPLQQPPLQPPPPPQQPPPPPPPSASEYINLVSPPPHPLPSTSAEGPPPRKVLRVRGVLEKVVNYIEHMMRGREFYEAVPHLSREIEGSLRFDENFSALQKLHTLNEWRKYSDYLFGEIYIHRAQGPSKTTDHYHDPITSSSLDSPRLPSRGFITALDNLKNYHDVLNRDILISYLEALNISDPNKLRWFKARELNPPEPAAAAAAEGDDDAMDTADDDPAAAASEAAAAASKAAAAASKAAASEAMIGTLDKYLEILIRKSESCEGARLETPLYHVGEVEKYVDFEELDEQSKMFEGVLDLPDDFFGSNPKKNPLWFIDTDFKFHLPHRHHTPRERGSGGGSGGLSPAGTSGGSSLGSSRCGGESLLSGRDALDYSLQAKMLNLAITNFMRGPQFSALSGYIRYHKKLGVYSSFSNWARDEHPIAIGFCDGSLEVGDIISQIHSPDVSLLLDWLAKHINIIVHKFHKKVAFNLSHQDLFTYLHNICSHTLTILHECGGIGVSGSSGGSGNGGGASSNGVPPPAGFGPLLSGHVKSYFEVFERYRDCYSLQSKSYRSFDCKCGIDAGVKISSAATLAYQRLAMFRNELEISVRRINNYIKRLPYKSVVHKAIDKLVENQQAFLDILCKQYAIKQDFRNFTQILHLSQRE